VSLGFNRRLGSRRESFAHGVQCGRRFQRTALARTYEGRLDLDHFPGDRLDIENPPGCPGSM